MQHTTTYGTHTTVQEPGLCAKCDPNYHPATVRLAQARLASKALQEDLDKMSDVNAELRNKLNRTNNQ